jgi:hypothetical protein
MSVCCILPYREESEARARNLGLVLRNLRAAGFDELVVVEHGPSPALDVETLDGARLLHIEGDGPFNKSQALNRGALATRAGTLVMADTDVLIDPAVLAACAETCARDFDAISPYDVLIDLDEKSTRRLWEGDLPAEAGIDPARLNRRGEGEHLCFCGGVYLIRRECYLDIGGQDERFTGWGGEDDAMSIKLQRLGLNIATNRSRPAFHLWHPRARPVGHDPHYHRNLELLHQYRTATPEALRALAERQAGELAARA